MVFPPPSSLGPITVAGAASSAFLSVSDSGYSEVNTTGKVADGAGNSLAFTIDDAQAAASGTIDNLIGAAVWDRGAPTEVAPVSLRVVLGALLAKSRFVVAIGVGTVPTTMAAIKAANPYWLEVYVPGTPTVNTLLRSSGVTGMTSFVQENAQESTALTITVDTDDIGYGPGTASSRYVKASVEGRAGRSQSTAYTSAGNIWIAALWGKSSLATEAETISASIEVL